MNVLGLGHCVLFRFAKIKILYVNPVELVEPRNGGCRLISNNDVYLLWFNHIVRRLVLQCWVYRLAIESSLLGPLVPLCTNELLSLLLL